MQGAWKILSWATGKGNDKDAGNSLSDSDFTSPASKTSDSTSFTSPASWVPDGPEEFEDSYGPAESESVTSTSTQFTRSPRGSGSSRWVDADGQSSQGSFSGAEEPEDLLNQRFRKFLLDQEAIAGGLHRDTPKFQSYGSSRDGVPERIRGGLENTRATPLKRASASASGLKQIQLEKLEKLEQLDKDWDRLFPDVIEEQFLWPWETLTEQQVALGKLDFKKFMVALSCLGELELKPVRVLTVEQIRNLDRLPLEEVAGYISREVAMSRGIRDETLPSINRSWLKKDGHFSFECNVDRYGVCKFKVTQPRPVSTLLHRTFGEDRVMPVYFNEYPTDDKFQLIREGIIVGLRRYRFYTFKDSGKDDFKNRNKPKDKDYQRAVKCFFVCTESLADVDLGDPKFKYFSRIHAARCHIMHIHTVPTMPKFASRLQLALSKSTTANLDLTKMDEIKSIPDILCKTLDNSGKKMSHTNGTGQISPAVAKLLPISVYKGKVDKKEGYPSLVQIRMFYKGMAVKGTFQVNHQLEGLKIHYRPSMVKVMPADDLKNFPTVNSLEILNTCHKPKEANLSQDLIVLLSVGEVPPEFFLKLLGNALDNIRSLFTKRELAYREVEGSTPEYSLGDQTFRMLVAGIPMNHPQMQKNLRLITQDRIKDLRRGCVPLPDSFYLMGTSDPTKEKVLKPNQVAIVMGDGKVCGKVLVYKNPGKHWGDVHAFDAVWDDRLNPYVGPGKYTIFFSVQGDRPVVDEIANSDLDGDLYWICSNTELISLFKPSAPWKRIAGKINYPVEDVPGHLTPRALETTLFDKFLKARFTNYKPMPLAATYWTAHMDRYLILKDAVDPPDELSVISESMEDLIDIFYRALDADKTGEEVKLPARLRPESWPHHMKKEHHNRQYYRSTSVLGRLYDMADINADDLGYRHEETMVYDPNFEYGRFDKYVEKWRDLLSKYNKEMSGQKKEEQSRVIQKYQQILLGEKKPLTQIWEEASALYHVNYEHALKTLKKGFPPSLHCAMTVAGIQLCEIYSRRKGEGEPYVWAPSTRQEILRPS